MNKNLLILIIIALSLAFATSAGAHEEPGTAEKAAPQEQKVRDWTLRFGIVVANSNGSTAVEVDPGSVDVSLSGGGGGFANLEYKVTPLLGLEFGTTGIGLDMNVRSRISSTSPRTWTCSPWVLSPSAPTSTS